MTVYTESDLTQSASTVLDQAQAQGAVRIKRTDGQEFVLRPTATLRSPLDVPGIETGVTMDDILQAIRDGRERPESPLDVGTVRVDPPPTREEIVSLVREGRDRG